MAYNAMMVPGSWRKKYIASVFGWLALGLASMAVVTLSYPNTDDIVELSRWGNILRITWFTWAVGQMAVFVYWSIRRPKDFR